jgi:ATP-dependent DNA helicase RecQ
MIIDILKGSKSEKVVSQGFDTLSTWGIMQDASAHRIRTILDWLVEENYLLQSTGEYPVIEMGAKAAEFLKANKPLMMMLPKEAPPREKTTAAGKSKAWENAGARAGLDKKTAESSMESTFDEVLLAKLKELRKQLAAKEGFPAYIVFSDASLRDMCRKLPKTLEEFLGVSGVGQVKTEKYGPPFIALIREYIEKNS